jgi:hypothetical protein
MRSVIPSAACLTAFFALGGCTQTMPSVERIMKPTGEAFSRLGSLALPWQQRQPASVPAAAPADEPAKSENLQEPQVPQVEASGTSKPVFSPPRRRAAQKISMSPAQLPITIRAPAPPAVILVPQNVICQTSSAPGERVRMECRPAD